MRFGCVAWILTAQIATLVCGSAASAAPCVTPPLTPEAIAQFKANPSALVTPNADTRTIEASVRDLAGTSAELAADLVRLAQGTTPRFQTAIAAGLAQAAVACNNIDQHAALVIQQAVASFDDGQFQASFAAVAGDLSTAAIEAAASSATGAAGSVVIVNPNRSSRSTSNPGGGGTTPLVTITAGALTITSVNGGTTTSSTTTAANPVSPTH